jgi:hypothetical protein
VAASGIAGSMAFAARLVTVAVQRLQNVAAREIRYATGQTLRVPVMCGGDEDLAPPDHA